GCQRGEPPTPSGSPSVAVPDVPLVGPRSSSSSSTATTTPTETSTPTTQTTATSTTTPTPTPPPDSAVDPALLPQTKTMPSPSGRALDARVDALWSGIVTDDPERAAPFFFPLGAYQQVKDVADPAADWRRRLMAAYAHDIHELHTRLG